MAVFPSMKARELRRVLERKPLSYETDHSRGSHFLLTSPTGHPPLRFAFHDADTVPGGLVRKILVNDVGLTEEKALGLL
jgi:predicted RNA binding protein YcfA (HicA-like mRNA interferase family)